jgi:hypothetical protein
MLAWAAMLIMLAPACDAAATWTGRRIMEESFNRHALFPYVLERQSMILIDAAGNSIVRKLSRYSRIEADGSVKYLLRFEAPEVLRRVALLAIRSASGRETSAIYLPASGEAMKSTGNGGRRSRFLDSDFNVGDLLPEKLSDFHYQRRPDQTLDKVQYYVVEASPKTGAIKDASGYGLRRLFIRKDNFFIFQILYLDAKGHPEKRLSNHDLKRVHGDMWRANMILMENYKATHKTLIKVNRRIFSSDEAPARLFTPAWLMQGAGPTNVDGVRQQQ